MTEITEEESKYIENRMDRFVHLFKSNVDNPFVMKHGISIVYPKMLEIYRAFVQDREGKAAWLVWINWADGKARE